ncbi:MAG: anti-sigma factor family protein [Euzebya sp.]
MTERHTCADHEPELSALLDGRLSGHAAARLRAHLVDCPGCLAELEGLRRARSLLRSLPVREVPAGLYTSSVVTARSTEQVAESHASPLLSTRRLVGTAAVTTIAVMVVAFGVGGGPVAAPTVRVDVQTFVQQHGSVVGGQAIPAPVLIAEHP